MSEPKLSAIIGLYNRMSDRFMVGGYGENHDIFERITIAADQGLVEGLEFTYGEGDLTRDNATDVKEMLDNHGIAVASVNPDLWGQKRWAKGTLGNADAGLRQQAVDYIKDAMDLTAEMGGKQVGLWPGQDGFDYYFEVNYQDLFAWWVEGVQTCADHNPGIRLALEFKPVEPRAYSFIDTAAKTLLLLEHIDRENVGVCLDVGHAMYGHESLGEVVALSQMNDKLFHLHFNDNYSDWDWDLNVGSVHFIEYVELMYWLERTGYDGWYSMDLFSYRSDPAESMYESMMWVKAFKQLVADIGMEELHALVESGDPIAMSRFFRELLFK
jgi:sugar phosphate isomerase/epimerase